MSELKNLVATIVLSLMILIGWQYFYENPKLAKIKQSTIETNQQKTLLQNIEEDKIIDREDYINNTQRVKILSKKLMGSISLRGLRFDDLELLKYQDKIGGDSKNVTLFSPAASINSYFVELGWVTKSKATIPDSDTLWKADKEVLNSNDSVNFSWSNEENIKFIVNISFDEDYMFTVKQSVINGSTKNIELAPYGLINKLIDKPSKSYSILHEGPIGVFDSKLVEKSYDSLKIDKRENYVLNNKGDWLGITDKYWLTAIFPSKEINFNSSFVHTVKHGKNLYQADYIGHMSIVKADESLSYVQQIFAGAKELKILDNYKNRYELKLFDRAVDFGWFYFLTKPMFNALQYFYKILGNFGLAILVLTIIIKSIMFPFANKSYKSMSKIKKVQPELNRIKELYGDDKMRIHKEMANIYGKYKINPLAGCLPVIIQIPVFFSLYKVLFVTIEMRHAKFFGWINDLSAPDPTSIFNLFGLIPWSPPNVLMIGIWPILMGVTMFFQQKMNPEPTDPVQAQVMKFLPFIFVFMFSSFPAGLVIYWAWNNLLSILQQYVINKTSK